MTDLQPLSTDKHQQLRWKRHDNYFFAAQDALVPVLLNEAGHLALDMPLAFIHRSTHFKPVVLQGLFPDQNLYVSPQGQWLGRCIPAAYRSYPFQLATTDTGQQVLCFDNNSNLLTESEGIPLFQNGKPGKELQEVLGFLNQLQHSEQQTERACSALAALNLLIPWQINVKTPDGLSPIPGLHKVDEKALNSLSGEDLKHLMQCGALHFAYSQLLSMPNFQKLGELFQAHAPQQKTPGNGATLTDFAEVSLESDTLKFSF